MSCAGELDWVAKLTILEGYRERDGLDWSDARLQAVDLQYSDVREQRGIARTLERSGRLERLFDDAAVADAESEPPDDTRAWFRGTCLRRWPGEVAAASWDSIVLDLPGRDSLVRVLTSDPMRGTRQAVGEVLERSSSAEDLLDRLGALA